MCATYHIYDHELLLAKGVVARAPEGMRNVHTPPLWEY